MRQSLSNTFRLIFLAMILVGCASSKLTIQVDLYNQDPRFSPPATPDDAQSLIRNMEKLRSAANSSEAFKVQLAEDTLAIFKRGWSAVDGSDTYIKDLDAELRAERDESIRRLETFNQSTNKAISAATDYMSSYASEYKDAVSNVNSALADVAREAKDEKEKERLSNQTPNRDAVLRELPKSLRAEEGSMRAAVEKAAADYTILRNRPSSLRIDWRILEGLINARYQSASPTVKIAIRNMTASIKRDIQEIVARAQNISSPSSSGADISAAADAPTLARSTVTLARELETLRNDLPADVSATTALAALVIGTSKFFQVIDRLQDAGDPVWRTVTDPANKYNWNQQFIRTYFYAEGNSSVVIVRDNPMRFRLHHGQNNPTALIQGQLEISRALADAALSIAGAKAGFPSGSASADGKIIDASGKKSESEELAKRRVKAEVAAARRAALLRSLQSNLRVASVSLAATQRDDVDAINRQRDTLATTLSSLKRLFEKSAGAQ